MNPVRTKLHGSVAVIVSDSPPVNALGASVRQGLDVALDAAIADEAVEAIVLRCDGRTFFAGADITEFAKPLAEPMLDAVINKFELCPKPVVAAIHGTALGGGLEVAMACHYRIADSAARLGLPEVKLGLLPGGGGTQRLPRLVGIETAARMCALGEPVQAGQGLVLGLIDALSNGDLELEAIELAREKVAAGPRPTRENPVGGEPAGLEALKSANAKRWRGYDAPIANIACVEASARLPFGEGIKFERTEFLKLLTGSQSEAQRHLFFAERQAARVDGLDTLVVPRDFSRVGVSTPVGFQASGAE